VDGEDERTLLSAISLYKGAGVQVIQNLRNDVHCGRTGGGLGYCRLALHYKMLLQLFFDCLKAPNLIFLEEDLEVAPDFFMYFEAAAPLLKRDSSLWCVSAWNDHGQRGRASNSTALYRTDIMPGLGWMLSAEVGMELWPQWPAWYWDDWMREPHIRKGRQCIFPEIPRTHTFGEEGTSLGMFYKEHLKPMLLNKEEVPWLEMVSGGVGYGGAGDQGWPGFVPK
jgi:alpha-1,3-mannosyl-glycoprotein beta-1,2-N-acetylglucosaminyltransferase